MAILVTGGMGYIGSHTILELLDSGSDEIIIFDNLSNSKKDTLLSIKEISKKESSLTFIEGDLLDKECLKKIFGNFNVESVIHFASLKSVGESVENPLIYYSNNLVGTINLLDVMSTYEVKKIVFSSSATVYGDTTVLPIKEDSGLNTTNPYGTTKLVIEQILKDLSASDSQWNITILRYFNPIGAHESGLIGEDPLGKPNNIMPYINKVARGHLPFVNIFGNDYSTHDGTGVRDYIHVVDLAKGHIKALFNSNSEYNTGLNIYNLGTGKGYSVLELIRRYEKVNNVKVPYVFTERRSGDIDSCYADATKAKKELGWIAEKNLDDMCRDSWNFVNSSIDLLGTK